jgi:hypothetical protein
MLTDKEQRLIELLEEKGVTITTVTRGSDREFDLKFQGTNSIGNFTGLARLTAIKELVVWYSDEFAAETDYGTLFAGDWSGVRDSEPETQWRLFERHVLPLIEGSSSTG